MKAKELRDWIDNLTDDIEFYYRGITGSICPFSRDNISLTYNGKTVDVKSVDEAMEAKVFDEQCLNEISEKLDI